MVMSKTNNSDGYLDIFEVAEGNYQNSEILLSACSTNSSYSADQDSFSGFVKVFISRSKFNLSYFLANR